MKGIGVSPGIAIGKAVVAEENSAAVFYVPIAAEAVAAEVARLEAAVARSKAQLEDLKAKVQEAMGEEHARILDAHILMLEDDLFVGAVKRTVAEDHINAEWALKVVVSGLKKRFRSFADVYFQERAGDVEDVGNRIQRNLAGLDAQARGEVEEDHILVARDLSPSDAALLDSRTIKAIVLDEGGRTSHTGIIAKSLRIPAVVGLKSFARQVKSGEMVIVDGSAGDVVCAPSEAVVNEYRAKRCAQEEHLAELLRTRDLPTITADGYKVFLQANLEFPGELDTALQYGAEGIGLYRTEFLYLDRAAAPPSEQEQYEVYRRLAERVAPSSAIIRTLDFGGGKVRPTEPTEHELNPILGLRAIRYCLKHPEIFKIQLRALLRASAHGRLKLMFPLVSSVNELLEAKAILSEAQAELTREGQAFNEQIQVGIMIEVPSAAMVADLLAKHVDFFSIGTNDLLQFLLAVDRDNAEVSYLYEPFHPAVLRTLKFVIDAGHRNGIRVGMCGEMAAEPSYTLLLVGLGLDELSANPTSIPLIKKIIRAVDRKEAMRVAERALTLPTAQEVEKFMSETLASRFPQGLV